MIWVWTVCPGLSVRKFKIITVCFDEFSSQEKGDKKIRAISVRLSPQCRGYKGTLRNEKLLSLLVPIGGSGGWGMWGGLGVSIRTNNVKTWWDQNTVKYFIGKIAFTACCTVANSMSNAYQNLKKMSHDMTKPTKWVCAQRRLRSAWASAQSNQSLLCAQWIAKDPRFLHADSEDWQRAAPPSLIWVFAGCTLILLVLSCHGSSGCVRQLFCM